MKEYLKITNECNMELMKRYPDNHFDLAIVDPPYGIGLDGGQIGYSKHKKKDWDSCSPPKEYFDELFRVSKNQIIWGANYFTNKLPIIKNYVFWYKKGLSNDSKFNEGELAYLSTGRTRMVDIWWNGFGVINSGEKRTHPTQKPVKLYEWLLMNYAKEGNKILDTHLGSGSIALACHNLKYNLTACELDTEYFNAAMKRLKQHQQQLTIFDI